MKFIDTLKRSGRNLKNAKIRTLLTALAIAVGGFTLTITLAASMGAREYADRLVEANTDPNSVIVAKDDMMFGTGTTKPQEYSDDLASIYGSLLKQLNQKDVDKLSRLPHVEGVVKDYILSAQFITREGAKKYTGALTVYNPAQKPSMKAGKAPAQLPRGSILLGDDFIPLLKFKNAEDAIGKTVTVQVRQVTGKTEAKQYKVAGVSTKPALALVFVPSGLFLAQDDAEDINNFINGNTVLAGQVPTATLHSDGKITAKELKQAAIDAGYGARTPEDIQAILNQIITVLQGIIVVFGLITLIASFFGVVNTQYISVLERTREIGLMKALGMSRRGVSRLFIVEATWIGFIGALLGSLLAIGVGMLLNPWISQKLNFGSESLLIFSPVQIAGLILFLMLVTTLAGLLPARKAAKLDPIEALRTE
jgi:putative ABC transport system permease protein